jgi:hypothetical protein
MNFGYNLFTGNAYLEKLFQSSVEFLSLIMDNNLLTGTIPSTTISNLKYLKILRIGYTLMHGSIPIELSMLEGLNFLNLDSSFFSGSIPCSSGLVNLIMIELENNFLTGTFAFDLMHNLKILKLHYNQFSGSIPCDLANTLSLVSLELNRNQLSGSLRFEILLNPTLQLVQLQKNRLQEI